MTKSFVVCRSDGDLKTGMQPLYFTYRKSKLLLYNYLLPYRSSRHHYGSFDSREDVHSMSSLNSPARVIKISFKYFLQGARSAYKYLRIFVPPHDNTPLTCLRNALISFLDYVITSPCFVLIEKTM